MSPKAGFLLQHQVIPRLRSAIPNVVHCVGAEDAQELIQDSIAMAAKLMHNVEAAGKRVTPGNIAYYTIQHIKSGRRSTGSSMVDVYGSGTQLNGHTRLTSLEDVAAVDEETGGEICFHDVLSNDQEDPGTKAARKMDWQDFIAALPERERAVIAFMVEGKSVCSMARKLGVCSSTIQHRKRSLATKILEFMGDKILVEIQRRPNWRNDLTANKERLACKHERQH
jgi:DNA-directed RNA polymerase specialized sigma24 family protein